MGTNRRRILFLVHKWTLRSMLCTNRYSDLAEGNRILAMGCEQSLSMGSLQWERALWRTMNEVSGDITHHPKIKSVKGSQLRLKTQTLHWFLALRLFLSSAFLKTITKYIPQSKMSTLWSPSATGSCAEGRLQSPHWAQHKRKHNIHQWAPI